MGTLGIDLGTANTVVCHPRRGIVLDEPSVLVLRNGRPRRKRLVAVGHDARSLLGRTPEGMSTIRPLHDGVITDLEIARTFITAILRRLAPQPWQRTTHRRAVIGVPLGATTLERRALLEAAEEASIGKAVLIPEPIAGAVGCGFDPVERRVHLVVDIGGGTAEVTAFCFGGIVAHRSCRVAGDEMTFAVQHHLREQHLLLVGELAAEEVKIRAATEQGPSIVVEGRDAATGRPRLATVSIAEIKEAIRPVIETIINTLVACLDELPAQSIGDIMCEGVLVIGGGSLVSGFDQAVEKAFGFMVKRAEEPLTCVAQGAAQCSTNNAVLSAYGEG